MKRTKKKLQLNSQTVARLSAQQLAEVRGGSIDPCSHQDSGCLNKTTQGSVRTAGCDAF